MVLCGAPAGPCAAVSLLVLPMLLPAAGGALRCLFWAVPGRFAVVPDWKPLQALAPSPLSDGKEGGPPRAHGLLQKSEPSELQKPSRRERTEADEAPRPQVGSEDRLVPFLAQQRAPPRWSQPRQLSIRNAFY